MRSGEANGYDGLTSGTGSTIADPGQSTVREAVVFVLGDDSVRERYERNVSGERKDGSPDRAVHP